MMRHLVVCCDGTWDTADESSEGVPTPTNVARLYNALREADEEGNQQLHYYHPGVGTDGGLMDKLTGGMLGVGLSHNIKSAYHWLATNFQPGDRISLFGFSRGAYTVRSLAGMIDACGLIEFAAETETGQRWQQVDDAYDLGYRPGDERSPQWSEGLSFHPGVRVDFLGVWDTVGALGIPDSLGVLNLFDVESRHAFHDTELCSVIEHARHAVAMDETRSPFMPTLWKTPGPRRHGTFKQVWFPGNHRDVGGGHPEHGLSDGALRWILDESADAVGLAYSTEMLGQIRPDPQGVLHNDCTGVFRYLGPYPRAVPLVDENRSTDVVHHSVFSRQANPPIAVGCYRSSRVLAAGKSWQTVVYANEPWNATGLYLEPGHYDFVAEGEWLDRSVPAGPDGSADGNFYLDELSNVVKTIRGWWETSFKKITHNRVPDFFGTKRVEGVPWMALVGEIADCRLDPKTGAQEPYTPFTIGSGCGLDVEIGGYLYVFANDAWGCYDNNRGSVTLTVTRSASAKPTAGPNG